MAENKKTQPKLPKPSDGELRILNVLWRNGPSTVRVVHEELKSTNKVGYTTILKLLQIMLEKGLVERQETDGRRHVYTAVIHCDDVQERLIDDLVSTAFDGSKRRLVMRLLEGTNATNEEISEIRRLLQKIEPKEG